MGDHYEGFYNNIGGTEVKHVVTESYSEDRSRTHNSRVEDAGAVVNPGAVEEYYGEEEGYSHDGEGYYYEGQWYSHDWGSGQQVTEVVATTSDHGHRRVHSASAVDKNLPLGDESSSSTSSEEAEDAKVKAKSKSKKGTKGQFSHLQEPDLDAHSDPGNAGSYYGSEHAINRSVSRVSSWLSDTSFREHPNDSVSTPQRARGMPRRSPPRRADMAAQSGPRRHSSPFPGARGDEGHSAVYEAQYYDKTPARDQHNSADDGYNHEQKQLAVAPGPSTAHQVALESVYRHEAKPLDKAKKFASIIALGFSGWSRTAASELSSASKKTAVIMRDKTTGIRSLVVPVLAPLAVAVFEESKDQLMGPDPKGRGRAAPIAGSGRGRGPGGGPGTGPGRGAGGQGPGRGFGPGPGRGAGGRGPGRGPGRGQPWPMEMVGPLQPALARPGMMHVGPRPGFATRPGMMRSMCNPRPTMRAGMPGHLVGGQPGVAPPRPNMIARPPPQYGGAGDPPTGAPVTRGSRVSMGGQPRPMGPGRGGARPAPPPPR